MQVSIKDKIVRWIKKQVKESGAKGILIGLSGGVDSCVVACLAKEAAGKDRFLALILPCHSQIQDLQDAKLLAKKLDVRYRVVDLSGIYDNLIKVLPRAGRLVCANLKSRLRMITLYYFANKLKFLVCGTGNKSEIMVGYFTKFGDGASDILPIGSLLKGEVRRLAEELGVPAHIISKIPTAGLWPGQSDEGEMGISYLELDDILTRLENKKRQVLSREKVNKAERMIRHSEHKRKLPKLFYPLFP